LTRPGIPHALRSIGAMPFLAVLVGTAIYAIGEALPPVERALPAVAGLIGIVFGAAFCRVFFVDYRVTAARAFHASVEQRLAASDSVQKLVDAERLRPMDAAQHQPYPQLALRYYELRAGAVRCEADGPVLRYQ
jgi:hypothetical protein